MLEIQSDTTCNSWVLPPLKNQHQSSSHCHWAMILAGWLCHPDPSAQNPSCEGFLLSFQLHEIANQSSTAIQTGKYVCFQHLCGESVRQMYSTGLAKSHCVFMNRWGVWNCKITSQRRRVSLSLRRLKPSWKTHCLETLEGKKWQQQLQMSKKKPTTHKWYIKDPRPVGELHDIKLSPDTEVC